ncbi:sensor domain-containing diguanylate cyclase/phosphohydrolase [Clostridium sp. B9]|uniref:sensor domain-containing diguanylate cyclase/phosphohydrolase n=1 Tax=Clostridium sp. B9 TaxID=3423224 RepID=UPI003D2EB858
MNLLEVLLDNIPYSIWLLGKDGIFLFVNKYYANTLGLEKNEIIGKTIYELFPKKTVEEYIGNYNEVLKDGKPKLFTGYSEHLGYPEGTFLECYLAPIMDKDKITCFLGILQNQSERKRYEEEIIHQKDLLNTIFDNMPDGIYHKDIDGRYLACNDTLTREIYGKSKEEIVNKNINELSLTLGKDNIILSNNDLVEKINNLDKLVIKTKIKKRMEFELKNKVGVKYIESIKVPVIDKSGNATGIVGIIRDITDNVVLENKLKKMSYMDKLTELYNRAYFDEKIEELNKESFFPLSFIMGDVNGLKIINDTIGHLDGDKLLINIANVIKNSCRKSDFMFRWGGDEFCILLPKTDEREANIICSRIRENCEKFSGSEFPLSIALGCATTRDKDKPIESFLIEAEDKVYREKLIYEKEIKKRIVEALQDNLSKKHKETKEHIERVEEYAFKLGRKMNLDKKYLLELCKLAKLHDIGKVGIPIEILSKPGKLTNEEFEIIKTHSEKGYRIAMFNPDIEHLAQGILAHHERYDGTGYPLGLKGEDIPFLARVICVVDAFDAMTGERTYKRKMSKEEAKLELARCAGTQFDPKVVECFLPIIDEIVV